MSLSVFTLNIEGDKHFDRWLPVIKKISPDIVCLQELFEVDCEKIGQALGMQWQFVPTVKVEKANIYGIAVRGNWGVGMFSRLPLENVNIEYYSKETDLQVFQEPNDPRRVVIIAEVTAGEEKYRVATTHFTWSAGGEMTQLQKDDFGRLQSILSTYPDLIVCGDFNAPRGKELFGLFEQTYQDNVPQEVTTTIDAALHYSGKPLQLVVDTVFTTPHYKVIAIKILEGLSDHKGIWSKIELAS